MSRGKEPAQQQMQPATMRLDKYLKVSRIIKRRTVAGEACDGGRVMVNGKEGKPGTAVKAGDRLDIRFGANTASYEITSISEHAAKGDAADMYKALSV